MERQHEERLHTNIIAADVVGYSRLMREGEQELLAQPKACRAVIDKLISEHMDGVFGTTDESVI